MPDFSKLQAVKTGTIPNFSLSPSVKSDLFGFVFEGFINISTAGNYTFYTKSDDGSKLYINHQEIVNNDETHGMRERSGSLYLQAGSFPIKVTYFERWGTGEGLTVSYQGPGITKRVIPDAVLSTGSTASSSTGVTVRIGGEISTAADEVSAGKQIYNSPGKELFRLLSNPVQQGILRLAVAEASLIEEGEVAIFDAIGRKHTSYLRPDNSGSSWTLSTQHLNTGIYTLLLFEKEGKLHRIRFLQP